MTYKLTKTGFATIFQNFASDEDALAEAETLGGYAVELAAPQDQVPDPTPEEIAESQLKADLTFGKSMIFQFLIDEKMSNRTPEQSFIVAQKLQSVDFMLNKGAISAAYGALQSVVVDAIFTQEMKDKYLNLIGQYLNIV